MKHILFFTLSFCFLSVVNGQDFIAESLRVFPGEYNSHEEFHMDQMGNQFIAGRGTGAIDFDFGGASNTLPETSFKDLYLAKYDEMGVLLWLLSFDGTVVSNQIRTINSDADGNVYVGGTFSGRLHLTDDGQNEIVNFGSSSMFVAKFDVNGNLVWQFTVGNSNFSQYPDEIYIHDSRLIIQLVYTGTFDVDPGIGETILDGSSNAMLIYDLDGSLIDAYSHRNNTNIKASVMDIDGNLYLAGLFSGLVSFDYKTNQSIISSGLFDAFIAKYDSDFNLIWLSKVSKPVGTLTFTKIDLDSNNDIITTGSFESNTPIGSDTTENKANYLVHVSQDGDFTDVHEILPESSFIYKLSVNTNDQIIISASFSETVDLDLSEEVQELSPMDDNVNLLFAVYESDLTLVGTDQIYAPTINTHTVFLSDLDQIQVLTDFQGEGKVAFGNSDNFTSAIEESFIFYTLDIEVCSPTSEEIAIEACNETIINAEIYTMSGQYQQILTNAEGCDSLLNILVTIHPDGASTTDLKWCGPYTYNGEILGVSGTYNFVLTTVNGCDSLVTLNLEIIDIANGITIDENVLTATEEDGDTYQWYDCDTEMQIEGATDRMFSPESSGSYRVQLFKDVCSFFTDCITFTLVGTVEHNFDIDISPNPTNGILYITNHSGLSDYKFSFYDTSGRQIELSNPINESGILDIDNLNSGMYLLKIENGSDSIIKKIIKF
jgi:hypothetical protein